MKNENEFYIGYLDRAPTKLGRFVKSRVGAVVAFCTLLAALLVANQRPFDPGVFEYLNFRPFEGIVTESPYPLLHIQRPGLTDPVPSHSQYYLVGQGKFGAQNEVAGLDRMRMRLTGALIYRDNQTMIEVEPGSVGPATDGGELSHSDGAAIQATRDLGELTFQGEIVDSKCFLGVMKPGNLKPHRACAVRCISGGIPPVLAVRQSDDTIRYLLLTGEAGRAVNKDVLDVVAEPVEITGRVVQQGDLFILRADPATYRRLPIHP